MTTLNLAKIVRALRVLAVVIGLVAIGALAADDVHQRQTNSQLVTTQQRQRPITDYNTAFFAHLDCIKAYEVEFFGDIADALVVVPDDRERARAAVAADRDRLRLIVPRLCPAPTPPTFDDHGNLTAPPIVRPQTFPPTTQPGG